MPDQISIELTIVPPISLKLLSEQVVHITANDIPESDPIFQNWLSSFSLNNFITNESDPVFQIWLSSKYLQGSKKTGVDAGQLWQMSLDDDYLYICVQSGEIGEAIWKRTVLFQT